MTPKLDDLEVTFMDAMRLLRMNNIPGKKLPLPEFGMTECWELAPRHLVSRRGIFVNLLQIEEADLTLEERDSLEGSSGDPLKPCLQFPCSFGDLRNFMKQDLVSEWFDPIAMADWVHKKIETQQGKTEVVPEESHSIYLLVIAVLLKLLKIAKANNTQDRIAETIEAGRDGQNCSLQNLEGIPGLGTSTLKKIFANANSELKKFAKR